MNILQMNGKKCIEILDGNDVEQCHKMNIVEFDKLNPCGYIQVCMLGYPNFIVNFILLFALQKEPEQLDYVVCPFMVKHCIICVSKALLK